MARSLFFVVLTTVGISAFAQQQLDATYSCSSFSSSSQYSLDIKVQPTVVEIRQSAPNARFAMLSLNVEKGIFQNTTAEPIFNCAQSFEGGYKIRIIVFEDIVHVLKSHPSARFAPLQYNIVQ